MKIAQFRKIRNTLLISLLSVSILFFCIQIKTNAQENTKIDIRIKNTCDSGDYRLVSADINKLLVEDGSKTITYPSVERDFTNFCVSFPSTSDAFFNGNPNLTYSFEIGGTWFNKVRFSYKLEDVPVQKQMDGIDEHYYVLLEIPTNSTTKAGTPVIISPTSQNLNFKIINTEVSVTDLLCPSNNAGLSFNITDLDTGRAVMLDDYIPSNQEILDRHYTKTWIPDISDDNFNFCEGECTNKKIKVEVKSYCDSLVNTTSKEYIINSDVTSSELLSTSFAINRLSKDEYTIQLYFNGQNVTILNDQDVVKFDDVVPGEYEVVAKVAIVNPQDATEKIEPGEYIRKIQVVTGRNLFNVSVGRNIFNISNGMESLRSNTGLNGCPGNMGCVECIAKVVERDGSDKITKVMTFKEAGKKTFAEAVDLYNTDSKSIVFTNNVYTALGCWDPSMDGTIVRLMQIGLGVSGGLILLRIIQAIGKLSSAENPNDKSEGVEMIWSAIIALLLIIFGGIGLRFIGVNVFKVLPPNTIEIEE